MPHIYISVYNIDRLFHNINDHVFKKLMWVMELFESKFHLHDTSSFNIWMLLLMMFFCKACMIYSYWNKVFKTNFIISFISVHRWFLLFLLHHHLDRVSCVPGRQSTFSVVEGDFEHPIPSSSWMNAEIIGLGSLLQLVLCTAGVSSGFPRG